MDSNDKKLPTEIVHFNTLRIEYGNRKSCECENPQYVIDNTNKIVRCDKCGALVEPFVALTNIAKRYDREVRYLEYLRDERQKLEEWQPRLRVIKNISEHYHVGKMAPICPKCKQAFDLKDIVRWTDIKNVKQGSE